MCVSICRIYIWNIPEGDRRQIVLLRRVTGRYGGEVVLIFLSWTFITFSIKKTVNKKESKDIGLGELTDFISLSKALTHFSPVPPTPALPLPRPRSCLPLPHTPYRLSLSILVSFLPTGPHGCPLKSNYFHQFTDRDVGGSWGWGRENISNFPWPQTKAGEGYRKRISA